MNKWSINWDWQWVANNFDKCDSIKSLNEEYNVAHGTKICYRTFKGYCQRQGLRKSKLTKEQDAFIRQVYPLNGLCKTTALYNEKFHTRKTYKQMKSLIQNRKITIADDKLYRELRVNKRGCKYQIGEVTQGWVEPKIKIGNNKFVLLGRYIWEQNNGKLPKGYRVIHLDNDIFNNDLDNLQAIPSSYCAKLMRNRLYSKCGEITKGAIMCFELQDKIKECVYDLESE